MDPTPPNNASFDCRLSPFHVETKCESRLLKVSLSILTSSPILMMALDELRQKKNKGRMTLV